jgi:hypothetical protein
LGVVLALHLLLDDLRHENHLFCPDTVLTAEQPRLGSLELRAVV